MEPRYKTTAYWRTLPRWKQVVLENPDLFLYRYFPEQIERLEDFHLELIDNALTQVRGLTEYPAGHGKTTLTSTLCPILEICRNPDIRIAIVAKNTAEGEDIMRAVQQEFVENELLVRDFGPFKAYDDAKAWSLSRIDVAKRTRRGKMSTISMFGARSKDVLGKRTDWTICDDVVTEENSATPEQRKKLRDWFDLCVETGPEHAESRLTVVGTRFHPNDLYGDLEEIAIEGDFMWKTKCVDAIVDEDQHITLWPARWPWKRLMQMKVKQGTLSFNKRYRNKAIDESQMAFREEYVKGGYIGTVRYPGCLDRSFRIGDYDESWRIVAGFDPAVGLTRSAKFCAHIILGQGSCQDHERCYWVINLHREQMTQPQQIHEILAAHEQYPTMLRSIVEANSYQGGLCQTLDEKMQERGVAYHIEPHYTDRHNKPNTELGVMSMSPWFERASVHIPWGDAHSQRKMDKFVDELIMYPGRTTDTVMAFWFAWRSLQVTAPKYASFNRLATTPTVMGRQRLGGRIIQNPYYAQKEAVSNAG